MRRARRRDEFAKFFPGVRQLENNSKERRKQFMRTRYTRPKCKCGRYAHYSHELGKWCQEHLPSVLRERLDPNWAYVNVILPLAEVLDRLNWKRF